MGRNGIAHCCSNGFCGAKRGVTGFFFFVLLLIFWLRYLCILLLLLFFFILCILLYSCCIVVVVDRWWWYYKRIQDKKPHKPFDYDFHPFSSLIPFLLCILLDGLAYIRPPLPSAVVVWLRCSFTAMSFFWWMYFFFFFLSSLILFFIFFQLHAQTITAFKPTRPITTRKTVWKMLNLSSRFRLTKRKCLFGFLGLLRSCVFSGAHDRNRRWMQARRAAALPPPLFLFSIRSNNSLFMD